MKKIILSILSLFSMHSFACDIKNEATWLLNTDKYQCSKDVENAIAYVNQNKQWIYDASHCQDLANLTPPENKSFICDNILTKAFEFELSGAKMNGVTQEMLNSLTPSQKDYDSAFDAIDSASWITDKVIAKNLLKNTYDSIYYTKSYAIFMSDKDFSYNKEVLKLNVNLVNNFNKLLDNQEYVIEHLHEREGKIVGDNCNNSNPNCNQLLQMRYFNSIVAATGKMMNGQVPDKLDQIMAAENGNDCYLMNKDYQIALEKDISLHKKKNIPFKELDIELSKVKAQDTQEILDNCFDNELNTNNLKAELKQQH